MFHVRFCDGRHLNSHQHKSSKTFGISQNMLGSQFWLFLLWSRNPSGAFQVNKERYLPLLVDSHPLKPFGFHGTLAGNSGMCVAGVMRITWRSVLMLHPQVKNYPQLVCCWHVNSSDHTSSQKIKRTNWSVSVVLSLVGLEYFYRFHFSLARVLTMSSVKGLLP